MTRDQIVETLRRHDSELRALGIVQLSLFGSMARGDARADSGVDLLASFDPTRKLSLFDILEIEHHLVEQLGCEVDLVEETALRPQIRERAARDALRAF